MFKHIEPWQPYHDFVHCIAQSDLLTLLVFFREELQSLTHPEFHEAFYNNYSISQRPGNITQRLKLQAACETLLTGRSRWIHMSSFPP